MKGGIVRRGTSWTYVVNERPTAPGQKQRKRWVGGFETYAEAKSARARDLREMQSNKRRSPSKDSVSTVNDLMSAWLASKVDIKRTTRRQYEQAVARAEHAFGSKKVRELHADDLDAARNKWLLEDLSPASVNLYLRTLHACFRWAVKRGYLEVNPVDQVDKVPIQAEKAQVDTFSRSEWSALLEEASGWHHALIYLALATGARRGELMGMRFSHVDFDERTWTVLENATQVGQERVVTSPKGGASRRIMLTPTTIDYLRSLKAAAGERSLARGRKAENDYVLVKETGEPPLPDSASQAVRKLLKRLGIEHGSLHTLRHVHATELVNEGLPIAFVASRLGHASTAITERFYLGALPASEQAASEAASRAMGL